MVYPINSLNDLRLLVALKLEPVVKVLVRRVVWETKSSTVAVVAVVAAVVVVAVVAVVVPVAKFECSKMKEVAAVNCRVT